MTEDEAREEGRCLALTEHGWVEVRWAHWGEWVSDVVTCATPYKVRIEPKAYAPLPEER